MKRSLLILSLLSLGAVAMAQTAPVKLAKKANHYRYMTKSYGEQVDTAYTHVMVSDDCYQIVTPQGEGPFVPGYSRETTFVDLRADSVHYHYLFGQGSQEECYEIVSAFSRSDIRWDTVRHNGGITQYVTSINSNRLEVFVQEGPADVNPMPYYGRFHGVVLSFWRNGQVYIQLQDGVADKKVSPIRQQMRRPGLIATTSKEMGRLKKERMIISHRIFDDVQLCWGKSNDHIEGNYREKTPFDSVLHFAGGTLALKRVKLPQLPAHYQTFVEIHQRSNGDAYDRTGSLFVIPGAMLEDCPNFFDGINDSPDSLPIMVGRDGKRYQGVVRCASPLKSYSRSQQDYLPPVELVRFFTSFGVGHFNERMKGYDGIEWEDENYYKQEVTEVSSLLQGDVWIGVWIGNYDGGGHKVTVDLKSYPNDEHWSDEPATTRVEPLFNTCNVLEMAGQNYGQLFGSDSLSVDVEIPEHHDGVVLRMITTGHGGWDGGDEFNPKANTILVDGQQAFTYTPWRCDCARYREWNPVSGNFWNGISSSDLSRSGWCPGTATQPVYFDLSHLSPGRHRITLAIPQGAPQEGSISHWSVNGALIIK